jgi:hypothetical protein
MFLSVLHSAPASNNSIRATYSYVIHITSTLYSRREHRAARTSHYCNSCKLPDQNIDIVYMSTRLNVKDI